MSLLQHDAHPLSAPSGVDYLFGFLAWFVSAAASLFLAIFGVGHLIIRGPSSQFGYELLPCFAAPVIASIAYALALSRSPIRAWPPRIAASGVIAVVFGSLITLLGYFLLVTLLPNQTSPNQALQRTGSAVTAPAADHHHLPPTGRCRARSAWR
jgi:hypothetical protein